MDRREFLAGSIACSLVASAPDALAQSGPLKIIFPFAAGGGGDALCRVVAQTLGPLLDRTVIVENRTGAVNRWLREKLDELAAEEVRS